MTKHFGNCKYVVVLVFLICAQEDANREVNDATVVLSVALIYLSKLLNVILVLFDTLFLPRPWCPSGRKGNIDKWVPADMA